MPCVYVYTEQAISLKNLASLVMYVLCMEVIQYVWCTCGSYSFWDEKTGPVMRKGVELLFCLQAHAWFCVSEQA